MRTTNKFFKDQVQGHIMDSVLSEDYGETVQEQLQAVLDEFKSWYSPYERKMNPGVHMGFKNWMLGLPSCFNIEYEYYHISQTLRKWFETCGEVYKERDSDKEAELYYHLITREFETLCRKNGLNDLLGTVGY